VPKTYAASLPAILQGKIAESAVIHTSKNSGQEWRTWRSEVRFVAFWQPIPSSIQQLDGCHLTACSPLYIWKLVYRSLLVIRSTVAVMEFLHTGVSAWQVAEFDGLELDKIRQYTNASNIKAGSTEESQANLRVPIYAGYLLRQTIARKEPSDSELDVRLLDLADFMLADYYSIQELLTLPPPIIYAEMTCTFLYLYIFTLPLALVALVDTGSLSDLATYFLVWTWFPISSKARLAPTLASSLFGKLSCSGTHVTAFALLTFFTMVLHLQMPSHGTASL
jgi:hypothetical protein